MRITGTEHSRDSYTILRSNANNAAVRYASASLRKEKRMRMKMPDRLQLFIFFKNSFEIPLERKIRDSCGTYFRRDMTHLAFRGCYLIIATLPTSRNRGPGLESETCGIRRWDHTGALIGQLREPWWPYGIAFWPIYAHGEHCVIAFIARFALSPFFSLWLSSSLFFSSSAESQPPGRATELIDCALQIDFEQKVNALARRPRRGWSETRPDAQAASLKSSSTL